jgi:hypothetical protein
MQPPHFKFKAAVGVPAVTDKALNAQQPLPGFNGIAQRLASGEVWLALAMQVARSA